MSFMHILHQQLQSWGVLTKTASEDSLFLARLNADSYYTCYKVIHLDSREGGWGNRNRIINRCIDEYTWLIDQLSRSDA